MNDDEPLVTWAPTAQRHPVLCNVCATHSCLGYARGAHQDGGPSQYRFVCHTCAASLCDHMAQEAVPLGWTRREALLLARLLCLLTPLLATVDYEAEGGWHVEISAGGETVARLPDVLAVAEYLKSAHGSDNIALPR